MTTQKTTAELIAELNEFADMLSDLGFKKCRTFLKERIPHIQAQADRLAELEAALTWQPIETAPMDGFFLVYENGCIRTMFRTKGEWFSPAYAAIVGEHGDNIVGSDAERLTGGRKLKVCDQIWEPTHWMPLPKEPQALQLKGEHSQCKVSGCYGCANASCQCACTHSQTSPATQGAT